MSSDEDMDDVSSDEHSSISSQWFSFSVMLVCYCLRIDYILDGIFFTGFVILISSPSFFSFEENMRRINTFYFKGYVGCLFLFLNWMILYLIIILIIYMLWSRTNVCSNLEEGVLIFALLIFLKNRQNESLLL